MDFQFSTFDDTGGKPQSTWPFLSRLGIQFRRKIRRFLLDDDSNSYILPTLW